MVRGRDMPNGHISILAERTVHGHGYAERAYAERACAERACAERHVPNGQT
jgi:hypothetical protein